MIADESITMTFRRLRWRKAAVVVQKIAMVYGRVWFPEVRRAIATDGEERVCERRPSGVPFTF